jgi:hypothetical protein
VQEEADPACGLPSDDGRLTGTVRSRQQQAGLGTWRPDHDPPLRAAVVGQRRRVLHELETRRAHEEVDRLVVVVDHHRDEAYLHATSVRILLHLGKHFPRG